MLLPLPLLWLWMLQVEEEEEGTLTGAVGGGGGGRRGTMVLMLPTRLFALAASIAQATLATVWRSNLLK